MNCYITCVISIRKPLLWSHTIKSYVDILQELYELKTEKSKSRKSEFLMKQKEVSCISNIGNPIGTDCQGICHEVIDAARIAAGISVDSAKGSFADDAT